MAGNNQKKRKKSTKTYILSFALILGFWVVIEVLGHMGLLSSKMLGLLIPICAYAIMAVSLNLVVGYLGELSLGHAAFMLAGATGLRYLIMDRRPDRDTKKLRRMDHLSYRLVALGLFLLTVTILTGAIWAEQAWSSFWTWDPKEVWALITWILYAVYLHLRLRKKHSGRAMAWFVVIAIPVVLFTFAGVNTIMPGLHSYG